ncbi:macoilin [Plutella xylostella]|uniref:macoilin n=1 Tax=Plutella xylostella TaxID=51655 RepID=UPI002032A880|nr:macoilin [Plutella xylostella]
MKRRNAETGKMRRPIKRTKISEGMYGNSMLYLKFVMLWAAVVLADYMLEFRFEFLWPFWMMLRSVYDSFKYQGLAFSVFFICIALTSDIICFFFMPSPWMFIAASMYVWIQCIWYTVADKGICGPTVVLCCLIAYIEGVLRATERGGGLAGGGLELCRPLAAHCVGYPVVTLGFGVKSFVGRRLRLRRQRRVRAENDFYYRLMRDALPESALEESQPESSKPCAEGVPLSNGSAGEHRHMNGAAGTRRKKELCPEHVSLQFKLEKLEKHLLSTTACQKTPLSNGCATVPPDGVVTEEHMAGSAKSSKCEKKEASTLKEEKRKNKNKDKDKEISDSHKSSETTKETVKEVESTKETSAKCNGNHTTSREREKEREREREQREVQREREREQREARECTEELKRVKAELAVALRNEATARRELAAAAAAERARRAELSQLSRAHHQLQHKLTSWRNTERTERATLERRLSEERRARAAAETQLQAQAQANARRTGECENETCIQRRLASETETATTRRDLQRARERAARLTRDLTTATEQVRALEQRQEDSSSPHSRLASAYTSLQERASHLERALSAETRVKLDLLSALGEAKRQLTIREGLITKQEKEMQELKAQMLAVMPAEFVSSGGGVSKLRLSDNSPLDPNATVYTPKQLCSDA